MKIIKCIFYSGEVARSVDVNIHFYDKAFKSGKSSLTTQFSRKVFIELMTKITPCSKEYIENKYSTLPPDTMVAVVIFDTEDMVEYVSLEDNCRTSCKFSLIEDSLIYRTYRIAPKLEYDLIGLKMVDGKFEIFNLPYMFLDTMTYKQLDQICKSSVRYAVLGTNDEVLYMCNPAIIKSISIDEKYENLTVSKEYITERFKTIFANYASNKGKDCFSSLRYLRGPSYVIGAFLDTFELSTLDLVRLTDTGGDLKLDDKVAESYVYHDSTGENVLRGIRNLAYTGKLSNISSTFIESATEKAIGNLSVLSTSLSELKSSKQISRHYTITCDGKPEMKFRVDMKPTYYKKEDKPTPTDSSEPKSPKLVPVHHPITPNEEPKMKFRAV